MANQKLTALTEETTPVDADLFYIVIDTATTPASRKITFQTIKDNIPSSDPAVGTLSNGKLSVTVVSNDLVVALKTLAGTDPSASDSVKANINGTVHTITAALSVTLADGTNWMNLGAAETATIEVDLFAYLGYNATDGVVIGVSRISYFTQYGDFSATSTNETYAKISTITTAASTDPYINIGRFAATLSAGAGYTWTVPTFTPLNLIQHPMLFSRWLTWAPTHTGFSAAPTDIFARYQVVPGGVRWVYRANSDGTSSTTAFTFTLPFTPKATTNNNQQGIANARDNGAALTTPCRVAFLNSAGNVASVFTNMSSGAWTAAAGKRIGGMQITDMEV